MIKYLNGIFLFLLFLSCTDSLEEISNPGSGRSGENSGVIYGIVFDSDTEMPLSGVTVSLFPSGQRTITGTDGRYEFNNLSSNNYIIQAQHADFFSAADALTLKDGETVKNDIRMTRGQNSLTVSKHEIDISDLDSYHSLLISNVGNKPIKWNLSFDDIFDPATGNIQIFVTEWEGELQPYETKELFIRLTVSATLNFNYAFPMIFQCGREKIGIVMVLSENEGKVYSKIIGKWSLFRTGWYEDGNQVRQSVASGATILTFKDDMTYELFNNYAKIWFDSDEHDIKLEDIWRLSYSSGSFTYNPMEDNIFLGASFAEGYSYKILKVTDYELILGSLDFDENKKEGEIYFFTKE